MRMKDGERMITGWRRVALSVAMGTSLVLPARVAFAQAVAPSEWTSLGIVATPDAPLTLTGNQDLPPGSLVATHRVSDTMAVPPATSLRIFGDMAVFGTQGGLILANL